MALTNVDDVIEAVGETVGSSYDKVGDAGYERSVSQALAELHWTLPITDANKEYWVIERTKRYMLSILLIESAHKFQYKKIYLHHRFAQYFKLLEWMDKEFAKAIENDLTLFDIDTWDNLGDYITNGFQYSEFGVDLTYDNRWT